MNERGLTTSQGEELYGSYVHNIEKRIDKRQSLLGRYKRTIEDLRVEFYYDENKENRRTIYDKVIKGIKKNE